MLQIISTSEEVKAFVTEAVSECIGRLQFNRDPEPEIIDGAELRKRLNISEPTAIRWRQKGRIPYLQIGSNIRYNWREVIKALEVPTNKKGGNR